MEHDLKQYAADRLAEYGYTPVLLRGKRPAFKDWQTPMEARQLRYWLRKYHEMNVGILLSEQGLAVVDIDDPTSLWVHEHESALVSAQACQTSRGEHRYFRIERDVPGRTFPGGDLKTRGVAVAPPSEHPETGWVYRWKTGIVPKDLLPVLPADLLRPEPERPAAQCDRPVGMTLERVRGWIRKAIAVSGQGGHNTTYRVACRLADVGLTEDQVLAELIAWQEDGCAVPKWTVAELAHKAHDAVQRLLKRGAE